MRIRQLLAKVSRVKSQESKELNSELVGGEEV